MGEVVAGISLAASIVQLVHFGTAVIGRLQEYQAKSKDTPAVFHDISVQLPLLVTDLRVTQERAEKHGLPPDVTESVVNIVKSCETHVKTVDDVLVKTMPDATDSAWKTGKKVILSFRQEEKARLVAEKLRSYVIYLTHHAVTNVLSEPKVVLGATAQSADQFRMLQWLSNEDPLISHNRAVQRKQEGTGSWYLESESFSHWRKSPNSLAWLYGIPGCGKTILCSTIIEALQDVLQANELGAVAYWYFDFNNSSSQSVRNMLRSLIKQLCVGETSIPPAVQDMCSRYRASGHQPTTKVLLAALHSAVDSIRKKTFLVLDALDEYPENGRQELLAAVKMLTNSEYNDIHILVTSRMEYDIEHTLDAEAMQKLSIHGPVVDSDISRHVRASLADDARLCRLSPSIKETIETQLVSSANGMFRWVVCQLDTLRACNKVSAIKKALEQLPPTLDATYERILGAIEPNDTVEAYHILQWLAFAERPLLLEEVAEAAVTQGDGGSIDPEDRLFDPFEVMRICKSLVSLSDDTLTICGEWVSGRFVRFAHFSVKEYLLSSRVLEGNANTFHVNTASSHLQIGQSCLSILLQNEEHSQDKNPPLIRYAAEFWFEHFRKYVSCTHDTLAFRTLLEKLFVKSPSAFQNWLLWYDVNLRRGHGLPAMARRLGSAPGPLYYAAFLGLEEPVRLLLMSGVDVNAYAGRYGTPLIAAASQGHEAIVELLLDHGAKVDGEGSSVFSTALSASCYFGYHSIAKLLLDRGAQPDFRRDNDDTALELACEGGHQEIVERLLERGSDVNLRRTGGYGFPLSAAAERGFYSIVHLLLQKGANVNNQGGHYLNAIQAAASSGSESIVQLLIDSGAHINVQGGAFGDPLRAASVRGHYTVVKILVEHGADIGVMTKALMVSANDMTPSMLNTADRRPYSGKTNMELVQALETSLERKAFDELFIALVREAHGRLAYLRSQDLESREDHLQAMPQLTEGSRPNLDRFRSIVKQAIRDDLGRHGQASSRFSDAALRVRSALPANIGNTDA
ncbi:MAG: hypothetical protein LQ337_001102 [Flavoplaca oasis]|nr:MAG: hypothetical protein LQ337_001102 [Flavoplaca oasis]